MATVPPPSRRTPRRLRACVTSHPGSVAMAAAALNGLVAVLETYRGRDRVVSDGERPGGALSCR